MNFSLGSCPYSRFYLKIISKVSESLLQHLLLTSHFPATWLSPSTFPLAEYIHRHLSENLSSRAIWQSSLPILPVSSFLPSPTISSFPESYIFPTSMPACFGLWRNQHEHWYHDVEWPFLFLTKLRRENSHCPGHIYVSNCDISFNFSFVLETIARVTFGVSTEQQPGAILSGILLLLACSSLLPRHLDLTCKQLTSIDLLSHPAFVSEEIDMDTMPPFWISSFLSSIIFTQDLSVSSYRFLALWTCQPAQALPQLQYPPAV